VSGLNRRAINANRYMHNHSDSFHYKKSNRVHHRPPRIFVVCSLCGKEFQAVENMDGSIHTFTTNVKRTNKKVYSFRLSPRGAAKVRKMQKNGEL
jgi:hypothetical protein